MKLRHPHPTISGETWSCQESTLPTGISWQLAPGKSSQKDPGGAWKRKKPSSTPLGCTFLVTKHNQTHCVHSWNALGFWSDKWGLLLAFACERMKKYEEVTMLYLTLMSESDRQGIHKNRKVHQCQRMNSKWVDWDRDDQLRQIRAPSCCVASFAFNQVLKPRSFCVCTLFHS